MGNIANRSNSETSIVYFLQRVESVVSNFLLKRLGIVTPHQVRVYILCYCLFWFPAIHSARALGRSTGARFWIYCSRLFPRFYKFTNLCAWPFTLFRARYCCFSSPFCSLNLLNPGDAIRPLRFSGHSDEEGGEMETRLLVRVRRGLGGGNGYSARYWRYGDSVRCGCSGDGCPKLFRFNPGRSSVRCSNSAIRSRLQLEVLFPGLKAR